MAPIILCLQYKIAIFLCLNLKEDRQKRLEEIASNRADRQNKRRQHRKYQTEQFIKSMQMLQANAIHDPSGPFEDYSIFLYRQTAPNFEDRVKDLEKKFIYVPVRKSFWCEFQWFLNKCAFVLL